MHHQQDYHLIFSKFIESRDKKFPDIGIGKFCPISFQITEFIFLVNLNVKAKWLTQNTLI